MAVVFYLGDVKKSEKWELLEQPVKLFDTEFQTEWFETSLGKSIIERIDSSEVVEGGIIKSKVFNKAIPPHYLSCGSKILLLAAFHEGMSNRILDGSKMGDNCFPLLFEIAKQTKRNIIVQVGRLLRESWGENDTVLFMPKNVTKVGYKACYDYLKLNTNMFYKGEGYGTQG